MIDGVRARLDRLPAAWRLAALGVVIQTLLAAGLLAAAFLGGDRVDVLVAAILVGIVSVAVVASLPSVLLWWRGRAPRLAAALAILVAVGTLVLNEGHPTVWPLPAALLLAALRTWAGRIDTATLLAADPDRFERVSPPDGSTDDTGGDEA